MEMTLEITNKVFRKYQMRTTEKESRIRARHLRKERGVGKEKFGANMVLEENVVEVKEKKRK